MPFQVNSFDYILCNHVLEHIDDDIKAMMEIFRVLNFNGTAILQVPIDFNNTTTLEDNSIINRQERIEKFGQYDHVRLYGLDYFKRLKNIGFEVRQVQYALNFKQEEVLKYGIEKNEVIPVCKKLI